MLAPSIEIAIYMNPNSDIILVMGDSVRFLILLNYCTGGLTYKDLIKKQRS